MSSENKSDAANDYEKAKEELLNRAAVAMATPASALPVKPNTGVLLSKEQRGQMVKTVGKYELYRTLGEGAFGKVKYAVNKENKEPVAIKILDKDKIQRHHMGAQIKREITIMKMIDHPNVVAVKDVFATQTKIFIVLEFVDGGELFDLIAAEGKLNEDRARVYFQQVVLGLEHCHSRGICHRDLKPENLLLDSKGNVKISDFGLSTLYIGDDKAEGPERANLLHTTCGTPNYVAPEVLAAHGYDGKKADAWSTGVVLFVLIAGHLPFEEPTLAALFDKIKIADFDFPFWFGESVKDLLKKILVADPIKRLSLSQIQQHPWMFMEPSTNSTAAASSSKPTDAETISSGSDNKATEAAADKKEDSSTTPSASSALPTPPPVEKSGEKAAPPHPHPHSHPPATTEDVAPSSTPAPAAPTVHVHEPSQSHSASPKEAAGEVKKEKSPSKKQKSGPPSKVGAPSSSDHAQTPQSAWGFNWLCFAPFTSPSTPAPASPPPPPQPTADHTHGKEQSPSSSSAAAANHPHPPHTPEFKQ